MMLLLQALKSQCRIYKSNCFYIFLVAFSAFLDVCSRVAAPVLAEQTRELKNQIHSAPGRLKTNRKVNKPRKGVCVCFHVFNMSEILKCLLKSSK